MNRRSFLQSVSGVPASALAAQAAIQTGSNRRILLGIDTYSLRSFRWNVFQQLDYADGLKLDVVQSTLRDFESLDEAYLKKAKDYAGRLGILIEPGCGCICPLSIGWKAQRQDDPTKNLLEIIRITQGLGAKAAKVYMGMSQDRHGPMPILALMEATIKGLRTVRSQALDAGMKLAVETHGDLRAAEAKTIIVESGEDFVGCCLDSGNPVNLVEDPLSALEVLGPYTVTTHIRDSVVYEHPRGAVVQSVAMGDGTIDFRQFFARFRELCPNAPVVLEILTGAPPSVVPYLEPDFWRAFPNVPGSELARYIALAKRGHPFMGSIMIGRRGGKQPPAYEAALKEQERVDMERSLEYCKKSLDLGIRWRA
jgi:sugar phosphate isomerase/epimerase